jgi:hypothetical protein
MALVITGATIWLLISLAFLLDSLKAPQHLVRVGLALLALEFVAIVVALAQADCSGGPCVGGPGVDGLSRSAVTYVVPALAAAFMLYVTAYGLRHHRRTQS